MEVYDFKINLITDCILFDISKYVLTTCKMS